MNVKDAINRRRAYRALKSVKIDDELLSELMEAASLAASCFNNQPLRLVFVRSVDALEQVKKALNEGNSWAKRASMIIAVASRKEDDCIVKDREYHHFDAGMGVSSMILRATERGLVAHPIAGYDPEMVKDVLGIPNEYCVITLIIVGEHSEDTSLLSEKQAETEKERPKRKPFSDTFFVDGWGK